MGKSVMLVLALASVWTWVLIVEGVVGLSRLRTAIRRAGGTTESKLLTPIMQAGSAAADVVIENEDPANKRIRIAEAMSRSARVVLSQVERGLPSLAVIASVAPFVGLFGTVYGIMVSFADIAASGHSSLAVGAPGIAEALAATAWGLAAAIPASVAYSRLGSAITRVAERLGHLIEEHAVQLVASQAGQTPRTS
ncbi:MAG: MotA/TolQ/ExbB proton channel family protein [Nitrococcus sp.]|nr:MotA/TolQ/ExbB proton channel family protein [Nitrococcus sp.]